MRAKPSAHRSITQSTLQNLARVVVPRLADWYAVDLVTEAGALERVSVHHPDPARMTLANDLLTRYPPPRSGDRGVWHVIDTGQPEWLAEITDELLEKGAQDPSISRLIRGLGLRSYICVPLVARGRTIGALTLVRAESGRPYKPSDVALAIDVGRRAAAAVDNAQLYQRLREEDRRKDEFLAMLGHELRNPLAPMRGSPSSSCGAASTTARAHLERCHGGGSSSARPTT